MNAKRAKKIRQAILPGREETQTSRGNFMRMLTQYEHKVHKVIRAEVKKNGEGKYLPKRVARATQSTIDIPIGTTRLHSECPRAKYKEIKRYVRARS